MRLQILKILRKPFIANESSPCHPSNAPFYSSRSGLSAEITTYLLEASRVVDLKASNFHIFQELSMAGERASLR